ncbi:HNH endonuclease signature motif containing protein [Microbispora sp. NBRC 16548]|uniref:HNH endonuclease signature motif containing protein n=1 Tax=Microbispora sp. NBRC 16548 TaxID=3030994 RepID=UPI0025539065|nr:HNH endonuclease signature motif containing protein [Microbispora sp. NBRC 16548]
MTIDGRQTTEYAHHVAYRWAYGALPEGRVVHHICGLRLCSNPEHLQAVDEVANILEMKERLSLQREIAALKAAIASLEAALNEANDRKGVAGDAPLA